MRTCIVACFLESSGLHPKTQKRTNLYQYEELIRFEINEESIY